MISLPEKPPLWGKIPTIDKRLLIIAFVTTLAVFALSYLNQTVIIQGKAEYDQQKREQAEQEIRIKELEEELQKYKSKEESYLRFLKSYNSPLGRTFVKSAIRVEEESGIKNFATFSIAVAGAESTFGRNYPVGSKNVWGIGGSNFAYFGSWDEGHKALSKLLKRHWGEDKIEVEDLPTINGFYASSPVWHQSVAFFWQRIGSMN